MAIDFSKFSKPIDSWCRILDMTWERMEGGPLEKWFKRENFEAFLWPSLIAAAFWTGFPTLKAVQAIGILIGLVTFVLLIFINRRCKTARQDLMAQVVLLIVLGGIIFFFGPDEAGTTSLVYRHVFIPIALITGLCLLFSAYLASQILKPLQEKSNYGEYLKTTEMFQVRGTRLPLSQRFLTSVFFSLTNLFLRPMQLLLPVTAIVLLAPAAYVKWAAWGTFGVMVVLLLISASDDRLDRSLALLVRRFSRNAGLAVSVAAIGLAAGRLAGNTYITTVLDSASGIEIVLYLFAAYALAWWYDYWTERLMGQQMMMLLGPKNSEDCAVSYAYSGDDCTEVPNDDRYIELFGLGRLLAYRGNGEKLPYFQAWSYRDFFAEVASVGAPGGTASPLPEQISQRLNLYFGSTALVVIGLLAGGGWILHNSTKNYEISIKTHHGTGLELSQLIDPNTYRPGNPAILVSASGGGTRAAVFTSAVLEGIAEDKGDSIRAGSGVSGGSAALAYYAAHREALRTGDPRAWNSYFDQMKLPYIRDVIERAQEWRMTVHGRVGILLAESFERGWGMAGKDTFSNLTDFGLMCNTTLAGRFDRSFVTGSENECFCLPKASTDHFRETRSDVAGGRLILTNLNLDGAFPAKPDFIPGIQLPVVLDDRDIRVERAAALSANFPPVFSNAAIDVDNQTRYWVTDGGAADNRGLEPLLFALRQAVTKSPGTPGNLPSVKVVIIEASGIDETFEQNRGLGSAMGAGAHFADQLDTELHNDLVSIYQTAQQKDDLQFYYIAMPRFLRTSGSFGTHWMLQEHITVKHPEKDKTVSKHFYGWEVVQALRAAYGCRAAGDANAALLADWIRASEEFKNWCELRNAIRGKGQSACGCPTAPVSTQ